ncbi:hypothetical protein GCM10008959_35910 [Deinococcus seoulensis]|uniref:Uncharacterized protein n=2 Tax=Deinococcus seoulensis TaxID=1837379 RepID=A0ABQ2RYX9_9DEIO|nr:hypothetical protein GCM10008959_35910 [Deinococcus seoulensis]
MAHYARQCMKVLSPLPALVLTLGLLTTGQGSGTAAPPALPAGWQPRLAALLPVTAQNVTLLERRPSISTVDLQLRVASVGGNPQALQQVIVSAARGVQPTYDERLGISRDEFKRYLVFQEVLASTGKTFRLAVTRTANQVTFGDGPNMDGVLRGVTIDLKTGEMRGPEGFTARPTAVPPSDNPDRGLEVRSGFQWRMVGSNATTGYGVRGTLSLLQLAGGRTVLSYTRTSMIRRVPDTGELIVEYTR